MAKVLVNRVACLFPPFCPYCGCLIVTQPVDGAKLLSVPPFGASARAGMLVNMERLKGTLAGGGAGLHAKPLPWWRYVVSAERGAELVFCELFTSVGGQSRTGPAALRQTTLGHVPAGPNGDLALQMAPFFWRGGRTQWGQSRPLRHLERVSSLLSPFASVFISPSHTCPCTSSMSLLTLPISLLAPRSICAPPRYPSARAFEPGPRS